MKNAMIVLALCLMACTSLAAQPQPRQGGPRGVNLDEIPGITTEQKEKIEQAQAAQREEMRKLMAESRESRQQMTDAERDARRKQMEEMRAKAEKEIEGILTPDQFKVYQEKQAAQRQQMRQRPEGQNQRGSREGRGPQARVEHRHNGRQMAMHRPSTRRMPRERQTVVCPCCAE